MFDRDDPAFAALTLAMKRNPRPLALLGAGASVDSGYLNWIQLLDRLKKKVHGKIRPKYESYLSELNDPAWQAEEYQRLIGKDDFWEYIQSEFEPKGKVGAIPHAIARLKFRHILTTNYDSCVEKAFEAQGSALQVTGWTEDAKLRQFFLDLSLAEVTPHLVYLHGRYYEAANVILTESSYANRYVRTDDANRKLFAILITQPVVFIGFSVTDPDLNHLMREVNARLGIGTPQHFALMGYRFDEQREVIKNRFEGKYGIQPVFYRIKINADGSENHASLLELLKELYFQVYGSPLVLPEMEVSIEPAEVKRFIDPARSPESELLSLDPLDQQKGRWGGKPERNNRQLRVENIKESGTHNYCTFDLVVEPSGKMPPALTGEVIFHLHQTFSQDRIETRASEGQARIPIISYGAFTVGAEADAGQTKLELDLAKLKEFPKWFRDS